MLIGTNEGFTTFIALHTQGMGCTFLAARGGKNYLMDMLPLSEEPIAPTQSPYPPQNRGGLVAISTMVCSR